MDYPIDWTDFGLSMPLCIDKFQVRPNLLIMMILLRGKITRFFHYCVITLLKMYTTLINSDCFKISCQIILHAEMQMNLKQKKN